MTFLHHMFNDQDLLLVSGSFVVIQSNHSHTPHPKGSLLGSKLWYQCSQCERLLLGVKRTPPRPWQDKNELWKCHNSVCSAAWVDTGFHYLSKLLQSFSKKLSLVGRATQQEPARLRLTMTLATFGAAETTAAARQCCLPASAIG